MGERQEAMYIVERYDARGGAFQYKLFRTRAAARKYAKDMDGRQRGERFMYGVRRATWGPEQ